MKLHVGLASSTHVDQHWHKMSKNALESMAQQINLRYLPCDFEHSGTDLGVILCGRVEQLEDGEWGLFIIMGVFESEQERQEYRYRRPNTVSQEYLDLMDDFLLDAGREGSELLMPRRLVGQV